MGITEDSPRPACRVAQLRRTTRQCRVSTQFCGFRLSSHLTPWTAASVDRSAKRLGLTEGSSDLPCRIEAIHQGHGRIENYDVWLEFHRFHQRLLTVLGSGTNPPSVMALDELSEAAPREFVVIGYEDSRRHIGMLNGLGEVKFHQRSQGVRACGKVLGRGRIRCSNKDS